MFIMFKKVEVVKYDPKWSEIYGIEAQNIKTAVGKNFINIYHIGSTSIPGLCAKPIMDILLVVKDNQTLLSPP